MAGRAAAPKAPSTAAVIRTSPAAPAPRSSAAGAAPRPASRAVRSVYRAPDGAVRTDLTRTEIADLIAPGGPCGSGGAAGALWVDLDAVDPDREIVLRELFRFHPLAVEDTR